jgi:hypothetical protein
MTTIVIPDFQFSGNYYPELLEDLTQYKRINVSELTDESEEEPFTQLLMAIALIGHQSNVLADLVALEGYLPTAKLRASVKRLLQLIDYDLAQPSPAAADLVMKLSGGFDIASQITAPGSRFTTTATAETPAIDFEDIVGHTVERSDEMYKVWAYDSGGISWTDHTVDANTPSSPFTPGWSTPAAGDALYFAHRHLQWNRLKFDISVAGSGLTGVWEYYGGNWASHEPDSVSNLGIKLRVELNNLLGTDSRAGAKVRVRSNLTGAYEELDSLFDTVNYVETGFLGQTSPSVDASDYSVGADWREPENLVDGTLDFSVTGEKNVDFDLPQSLHKNWQKVYVVDTFAVWMRYRIISVSTPSTPQIDTVDIDDDDIFLVEQVTQGISRQDDPLASSTGLPDQAYTLLNFPVIDDNTLEIIVDESGVEYTWTRVDNFLSSTSVDRHYIVDFDDNGQAIITFGDSNLGKIPPAGTDNIRANYRTMVNLDGNVGPQSINQNQSGSAYIASIYNPRSATGYQPEEGHDSADLERAKRAGSASVRVGDTASSVEEVETLTVAFQASDGSKPFSRCKGIEEGYGPKTIEAVVVGAGGQLATSTQLQELEDYFNGIDDQQYGVLVINHEVTASNWEPKSVPVTATVYGGNLASVQTALTAFLNPEAKDEQGDWQWNFGGEVPVSRIVAEIFNTTPVPRKVVVTSPPSDVQLNTKELPSAGILIITIIP